MHTSPPRAPLRMPGKRKRHGMVSSGLDKPNAAVGTQPRRLQSVTMMGEQAEPTAALPTFTAMGTMTTRIAMARHAAFTILNCFIEEDWDSQRNTIQRCDYNAVQCHPKPVNDCDPEGGKPSRHSQLNSQRHDHHAHHAPRESPSAWAPSRGRTRRTAAACTGHTGPGGGRG